MALGKTVVGDANLAPPAPVLVLGGCTGVGKTAILYELRKVDQQILDLEGLAKHRGSAFGATSEPQPSNEAFENILAFAVRRVTPKKPLWIEHEGKHVGKASLPLGILSWITNATGALVMLTMSKELRVRRLVDDYCNDPNLSKVEQLEQLKNSVNLLSKRLGGQRVKDALRLLDEGRWNEVAGMMLDYYDKLYEKWASQSRCAKIHVDCPTIDAIDNARRVLKATEQHGYCHCSICRRLSGAPFSCQALFTAAEVQLSMEPGANLTSLQTSKGVERTRCASCLAPVRGLLLGGKVAAVPLGLLCSWRGTESPL
ncbi:unnamed protein product, partial [Cladocopium goreaui]